MTLGDRSVPRCDAKRALLVNYRLRFAEDCLYYVNFATCSVILLVKFN